MTDWQPWPPPPDGELIEVEVPSWDTGSRYIGCVNALADFAGITILDMVCWIPKGGWSSDRSTMGVVPGTKYEDIPPTARWRRV